jgi:hypothetical protein
MTDQATRNYPFGYNLLYTPYSTGIRWLAQFNSTYGCPRTVALQFDSGESKLVIRQMGGLDCVPGPGATVVGRNG